MKKTAFLVLILSMVGWCGCSMPPVNGSAGLGIIFDGDPLIFDSSVTFMGMEVGRVLSREWGNGVTRVYIDLDSQYDGLKKSNVAAVVKSGRLHLCSLGGYGYPLSADSCIGGFKNTISFQLFKLKHIINNVSMSADRRAQRLVARSGLAG
jgi:hypothetical protein